MARKKLTPKSRTTRKGLHFRKVSSWIEVARVPQNPVWSGETRKMAGRGPFVACVQVGTANLHFAGGKFKERLAACGAGTNPRAAIAAAMKKAATSTARRRGAFAGLAGLSTRRRRRRRRK